MGGVAGRKQPVVALLAPLTILLLLGIPAALAAECERTQETSSPMFGASWSDNYVLYTQDYNWKQSGDITKINLYYGEAEGCVKGVKPQYGSDPANAQRLGVETKSLLLRSMQLRAGERIVRAEYKATPKCVEYLSLRTNQGRQLAVGKHDSPTPTTVSAPANPSSYLGYINGHTAKPMANPHVGKLMQLQLVWVSAECAEGASSVSVSAAGNGGKQGGKKKKDAKSGVKASIASSSSSSDSSDDSIMEQQVGPKCKGNHLCKDGKCATSSCTLAGLGGEVSNMMCYGTNMRLPFLSSGVDVSPCSFLACKLDESSCTSAGLMGMGGFCTGKVVEMGAASMLHPQGKQWLGYPCVEHRPAANLGLRAGMLGELTSAEDMVVKAWKVCDCVKKAPMRNSLAIMMPNGTITSFIFGKGGNQQQKQREPTVAVPLMPVYDMGIRDVVTQWLAAKAGNAALPTATIPAQLASDLKQLVPGFMTPSILIANTSAALMAHPDWMSEVPVFVLSNPSLAALKAFLPDLTSLPTLALAPEMSAAEAATLLELPKNLQVADITVDVLPTLASKLGLPTFLKLNPSTATTKVDSKSDAGPHVVPLDEMHIGNVVVQWATAVSRKAPLPTLTLKSQDQLTKLQEKIPGLVTPSIIVPNISHALLFKPQKPALPLFEIPAELSSEVMTVLTDITSLPSYLVLADEAKQELPKQQLTDFIAPNMRILVDTLAPAIPMMLKQVAGMAGPTVNVSGDTAASDNSALQSFVAGPWGSLLSSITEMPDMFGESSSIDMGSINQVIGAVKAALETSGFKLPYLTMTEDTLQKWGVKKIEGFVTNIVTRAVSPREDPSLIDDSDDDDEESEWRPKNSKRKSRRNRKSHPAGDTDSNPEAVHTAKQHTKVAAVLSSLKEEHQTDAPSHKSEKTTSIKQQQEQRLAVSESQQQPASDAAAAAAAAGGSKPSSGGKKTGNKSSKASSSSSSSSSSSTDAEPPSKPAYTGGTPTIEGAATTPAAATTAATSPDATAAAVPTTPATAGPKGVPVPTMPADAPPGPAPSAPKSLTPSQKAAEAEKKRAAAAAAEAAAAEKERLQKEALGQQQAAAAAAAAAKKGVMPVGTVDEDGAVVVDLADARRAFMTADQWAGVAPEHKEKLIKLLLGSLE